MSEHRFTLFNDHGRKKLTCPKCNQPKCFTPYIDTEGEFHFPEDIGRCDHEKQCGWHRKPKHYFQDNPNFKSLLPPTTVRREVQKPPELPTLYMSQDLMLATLKGYERNALFMFMSGIIGEEKCLEIFRSYNVGTAKMMGGSTVFWQVDGQGRIRTGKVMRYGSDGHRVKEDGNVISDYNELGRNVKVCKDIKQKYGLTFGDSTGKKVNADRLRPAQREMHEMKTAVLRALESSKSWAEFHRALEADDIEASFSIASTTGQVRGISFAKDGHRHSGSKLSKQKLTYGKLAAKFGPIPVEKIGLIETQSVKGVGKTPTLSQKRETMTDIHSANRPQTASHHQEVVSKTVTPSQVADDATSIQLIPLSLIVELMVGPAIAPTPGGGGTTNDLDWNDDRRRRQEARENQNISKSFRSRRR